MIYLYSWIYFPIRLQAKHIASHSDGQDLRPRCIGGVAIKIEVCSTSSIEFVEASAGCTLTDAASHHPHLFLISMTSSMNAEVSLATSTHAI